MKLDFDAAYLGQSQLTIDKKLKAALGIGKTIIPAKALKARIARLLPDHRKGILLCDEKHIHVYTTAGAFSVEWIDWEYGGKTNHAATAAAIEERMKDEG